MSSPAGAALNIPGIPSNAQFPNTMPTFAPNGYQQLGSPNNTASDFSTSVTRDRRFAHLAEGPPHHEDGARLALGTAQRDPTPLADRIVCLHDCRQRSARGREHRQRVRELPAGTGADLRHRPPADGYSGTRTLSGVLHPGRLESIRPPHDQPGAAIHAEFSINGDQRPDRRLQSADTAARVSGHGSGAAAQEKQLRPALWRRLPRDGQDHRQLGVRARLDRDGGDHDAVHDAELSVPAGRVAANARQHRTGVRAGEGTDRHASRPDANRRPRTRRVHR